MPNTEPISPPQANFQKECCDFVDEIEYLTFYIREKENQGGIAHRSVVYEGLMRIWNQVADVKDAGLDMVAEAPKCALVAEAPKYWFIEALADQTPFEHQCDSLEYDLEQWARSVLRNEAENFWIAGLLENMALQLSGQYYLFGFRAVKGL
ncbi:hypothetical protein N7457_004226 [Penicillium paradoxum]|uniref:uncharacterized protein n=1 Tax=Penicillium paradoxum TaxID=176176 RepID=UPI0025488D6A|nr:uncharacterized protein N7457_004226 [Penicillium paradoxum]KAJ5782452.1 hypothetical protein N7457_004226 [Penicillium paradoxum]